MSSQTGRRAAVLAAAVLLLAACSTSDDSDGRYSSLLRLVPADPEFREGIAIVDYETIRALPGYEASRPFGQTDEDADANPDTLRNALGWHGVGAIQFELLGFQYDDFASGLPLLAEGFGISLADVDRSLLAGAPPRTLHVAAGDFSPNAIEEALASCEDCEPGERLEYAGLSYRTWGGGEVRTDHRNRPPAFDDLGRGGLFRFTDGYAIRSNFTDAFEASLDASLGTNSLLGDDSFRLLAETLDRHQFVAAYVGDAHYDRQFARQFVENTRENVGATEIAAPWDLPEDAVLPAPYEAFAIGVGVEGDEPYTLLVLAYPTESEAAENVARLETRLATGLSEPGQTFAEAFTSTEVTTDRRLLVATLRGQARFAIRFGYEPLLLHE